MGIFSDFTEILNGWIMPVLLILCGIITAAIIKLPKILRPKVFFKTLAESSEKGGTSPAKAMTTALAGTLGVGNMAGVASAICAGGAGAVMWMWIGALVSMSVKYSEIALAVHYRRRGRHGNFIGGAMYTIRDGMKNKIGRRSAAFFGGIFALMCIVNSLVTGNIVQSNSAAAVFSGIPKYVIGIALALGITAVAIFGSDKISSVTFVLIPILSGIYIFLSMSIIFRNYSLIPEVMSRIIKGAFTPSAVIGGIGGYGIKEAVRFGITRGIFSNEAGCGTAPSAHAGANVKSPHHQGCFGIFEVIADTLILCSMTAFAIIIAQIKYPNILSGSDGIPLTLLSYGSLLGDAAYYIIGVSVILFAFATIIAQLYYGAVAIGYFTESKLPYIVYIILAVSASIYGSVMSDSSMWIAADLTVGVMTVINVTVLLMLRRELRDCITDKKAGKRG